MGSRAAPVRVGVERGFATTRSLLADIDINDSGLNVIEAALESRRAPTGPENTIKASKPLRKRATKTAGTGEDAAKLKAKPKPRGRKPKTTIAEQATADASNAENIPTTSSYFAKLPADNTTASTRKSAAAPPETNTTKPRKPRTKKSTTDDGEIQTTIKKARVTKPRGATKAATKAQDKAAEVASAHFRTAVDSTWDVPLSPSARSNGPPKQRPPDPDRPLDLDEAVSRRRDWTPPPDTERQGIPTSSSRKENKPVPEKTSFTSLLSGYSYARLDGEPDLAVSMSTSVEPNGGMKRRRVEVGHTPNYSKEATMAND
jgi:hypothetical protein